LIAAQHIHSKPFPGMQMSVRPRPVIHANQNQHRIKRHCGESIRRHAVDLTVLVDGDDRNPGCETSHRLAEIARAKAHTETCGPLAQQPCFEWFPEIHGGTGIRSVRYDRCQYDGLYDCCQRPTEFERVRMKRNSK
jgi:hypothetical protein